MRTIKTITCLLFLFAFTCINAQPHLKQAGWTDLNRDDSKLLIFSDKDELPISNGISHQLVPEFLNNNKVRYHFADVEMQPQWYKHFTCFKLCQPAYGGFNNNTLAVYDVTNTKFLKNINTVDNKQYIDLIPVADAFDRYYYYLSSEVKLTFNQGKRGNPLSTTIRTEDGINYLYFEEKELAKDPVYLYTFDDADFINEDLPDKNINIKAKYLFLQRNYKLGQTYNTVIFPVDVPVKDYNHVYNDGSNRMTVYKLESVDEKSLHFVKDISGVLLADTPYIIRSQKKDGTSDKQILSEYYLTDELTETFSTIEEKTVVDNNGIQVVAQYKQKKRHNKNTQTDFDVYVISSNQLVNCRNVDDISINRFRWYIKRPKSAMSEPMTMTFDGVTEIESVEANSTDNGNVYDLNGIKCGTTDDLTTLKDGYYIVDGKVRLISQ